jgi:hypothetical protein
MKKIPLIFAIIITTMMSANCQSDVRKEVGIVFRNLDYFGITYRTGTDQALWRISGFSIRMGKHESYGSSTNVYTSSNAGVGVQVGREFRKSITDQLQYRYGVDLACSYDVTVSDNEYPGQHSKTTVTTFRPGVVGVLGN